MFVRRRQLLGFHFSGPLSAAPARVMKGVMVVQPDRPISFLLICFCTDNNRNTAEARWKASRIKERVECRSVD